jgi:viologen exporter family transport system permease protein
MRRLFDFYVVSTKISMMIQFQYRLQSFLYVIWLVIEPVIYLVVWSTIARSNGGSVNGFTPGGFAAYYIVWMLVRQMNIVRAQTDWEWRIRNGRLSAELMRPIHPIHNDVSDFAGAKVFMILLWLPMAAALAMIFKPDLHPTWLQVVVFFVAIWGAYLLRSVVSALVGLITFWTTRVGAVFQLYFAVELILSGRLVPMTLMPDWVQRIAMFLPFQSMFYFPIIALTGSLSTAELLSGLGIQVLWFLVTLAFVNIVWQSAIRRFSAVGN